MELRFHPAAFRELRESADFYVARSPRAAAAFAKAVDQGLTDILRDPQRFERMGSHERARSVTRFPFRIIYRLVGEVVFVVAIAHTSRRPGYWKWRKQP